MLHTLNRMDAVHLLRSMTVHIFRYSRVIVFAARLFPNQMDWVYISITAIWGMHMIVIWLKITCKSGRAITQITGSLNAELLVDNRRRSNLYGARINIYSLIRLCRDYFRL